ncbi:MAG: cupin domain-containing protein [Clostridia bacterium]|jgi:quercetin dioxygenase-like cupin family protein|nr:cupin domain-containing protein [Clostridia bacterium]
MEKTIMKNIEKSKILDMKDLVAYQPGQIVSKTLVQNKAVNITLFAFAKDEEISSHESGGDAMVTVLDGVAGVTIADEEYAVSAGQTIIMPAGIAHAVMATEQMKFLLTVVF